jgi:prepilin-type N-terminal cleavage/methylation domain-containing protein
MKKRTRKQRGFSLIELLIVVAIILIIAAIAIPNLLRARISANEASAAESIRTIATAQMTFNSTYPVTGFSTTVAALGPPAASGCPASGPAVAAACLIDWNLSQATAPATAKTGYYFGMGNPGGGAPVMGFTVGGSPGGFNVSGVRGFCSSEDAVIHFNPAQNGVPTTSSATCYGYAILQ